MTATIENRRVAGARLRLDAPASDTYLDSRAGLRIDLLRLKKIALEARSRASDAEDVAFLEARLGKRT